jgi:hypothetical protein
VGAVFDVDAVRFDVALPAKVAVSEVATRGIRSAWFRHVITTDPQLLEHANTFQLGWVHEAFEITVIRTAIEHGTSLEAAVAEVSQDLPSRLESTMEVLFQRVGLVVDEVDVAEGPARLLGRLQQLLQREGFATRLAELAPELWRPNDDSLQAWLRTRLLATTGQAALAAARLLCPEHDPEGLLVDVEPGVDEEGRLRSGQVWLSERSIGGGGFLEAFAERLQRDPRRFLRLMQRASRPSPTEVVDYQMRRILDAVNHGGPLADAIAGYRGAPSQAKRVDALGVIREALRTTGLMPDHAVVSALANRLLRPGSTSATDRAIQQVVDAWQAAEQRLGIEIDVRTWAFLSSERDDLDYGLPLGGGGELRQRRLDALRSLLWPRGWQIRADVLQSWNPYATLPSPAPDVFREILIDPTLVVDVADNEASARLRSALATDGSARLRGQAGEEANLAAMLVDLATHPIETEFLHLHPRVADVDRTSDGATILRLELAEVSG